MRLTALDPITLHLTVEITVQGRMAEESTTEFTRQMIGNDQRMPYYVSPLHNMGTHTCCSVHVLYMCVSAACGMHTYTCTSCHDLISIEYVRVGAYQQKYMLGIRST